MRNKISVNLVCLFVLVSILNGLVVAAEVNKKAPQFTLDSFDRKTVSLAAYTGKIVVLEWLNYECPFVKAHYEDKKTMIDLANKYRDKNVIWLAINSTGHTTVEGNKNFAKKYNIPYLILDDRKGAVARAYAAKTTPHMFIIDTKGNLAYNGAIDSWSRGVSDEEIINYVDKALTELIAGKKVSTKESRPYGCSVKYKSAPGFVLKSFDGKKVKLGDYLGKMVVLEWFNFQCPFVKHHYETEKTMIDLAKKYKDKDVVWFTVNSTSHITVEENNEYAKQHGIEHPVLDDRSGDVGHAYGAKRTPHMFIINKKGDIVYEGAIDNWKRGKSKEEITNYVDKALTELTAGKTLSTPTTAPYGCTVKYAN